MSGVYLAYSIDQSQSVTAGRGPTRPDLRTMPGVSWIYDPGQAFDVGPGQKDCGIREINAAALEQAAAVVAWLPPGQVSVGVPMEIDRAARAGKPVVVITGTGDHPSWMLQFSEENVRVVPAWDWETRGWLSEALRGPSERLAASRGARLPVVVSEGAEAPRRGYDDDAGLDLVVSEYRLVEPGEFTDIPCGVSVELPDWSFGMITGRSSTLRKRGLMVNQGIIDAGYRGPLFAGVWNLTDEPVPVRKGERIAQLLILENGTRRVDVVEVDALEPGSRGEAGFGSTGA